MQLVEIGDFVQRALVCGRRCYLVSSDVAGAFDNVPHAQLMSGLRRMGVHVHIRRLVHNWLRDRTFQV